MPRKKLDFTREEVEEELAFIATLLSEGAVTSFGENFFLSAMNMPLKSFENDENSVTSINFSIKDINDAPITQDVYCAYSYAEGIRYGDTNIPDNFLDGMGEFYSFVQGTISLIEDSKFKFLYDLTSARATLDNGDHLSIKELALLAGVDERTVRNAASSKESNKLGTKKSGGTTIIENKEAKRWLSNRPDFKPTEYIEDTTLDTPRYFENEAGFGRFITYRREELGLAVEDLADSINIDAEIITDLEKGIDRLFINQVSQLAVILNEDPAVFVKNYMRIFHIQELADIQDYEYRLGSNIDDEEAKKFIEFKLKLFKTQLNLESQLHITKSQKEE